MISPAPLDLPANLNALVPSQLILKSFGAVSAFIVISSPYFKGICKSLSLEGICRRQAGSLVTPRVGLQGAGHL